MRILTNQKKAGDGIPLPKKTFVEEYIYIYMYTVYMYINQCKMLQEAEQR